MKLAADGMKRVQTAYGGSTGYVGPERLTGGLWLPRLNG